MQDASDNLSRAATADEIALQHFLEADWYNEGYITNTPTHLSIDDLTDQSNDLSVDLKLFDGLPDELAFLDGSGVPEITASLQGREMPPQSPGLVFSADRPDVMAVNVDIVGEAHLSPAYHYTGPLWVDVEYEPLYSLAFSGSFATGGVCSQDFYYTGADDTTRLGWGLFFSSAGIFFFWEGPSGLLLGSATTVAPQTAGAVRAALEDAGGGLVQFKIYTAPNIDGPWTLVETAGSPAAAPVSVSSPLRLGRGSTDGLPFFGLIRAFRTWGKIGSTSGSFGVTSFTRFDRQGRSTTGQITEDVTAGSAAYGRRAWAFTPPVRVLGGEATTDHTLTATQYWSPLQPASPLYGVARDLAPLRAGAELITSDGLEQVRLFTGLVVDTPVQGDRANLTGISRTRLLLSRMIRQPPVVSHGGDSLTTTWGVSWILHACGIYPSPPAVPFYSYHNPLHGGLAPYVTNRLPEYLVTGEALSVVDEAAAQVITPVFSQRVRDHGRIIEGVPTTAPLTLSTLTTPGTGCYTPTWAPGPYVAGVNCSTSASGSLEGGAMRALLLQWVTPTGLRIMPAPPGPGPAGRLEMYLRGDPLDNTNTAVTGAMLANIYGWDTDAGTTVDCGRVTASVNSSRVVRLAYADSNVSVSVTGGPLPSDGLWHLVGYEWTLDSSGGSTGQLRINVDGTITASSNFANAASGFSPSGECRVDLFAFIPISEIQMSQPPTTVTTWLGSHTELESGDAFEIDAEIFPGVTPLAAVLDEAQVEAYEALQRYAQAEPGRISIDEHDGFHYWGHGWEGTPTAQTLAGELGTTRDTAVPQIKLDPTRIRNLVQVTYPSVVDWSPNGGDAPVLWYTDPVEVQPGTTDITVALAMLGQWRHPDTMLDAVDTFTIATSTTFTSINAGTNLLTIGAYAAFNTRSDGTGSVITTGVSAEITEHYANSVVVRLTNNRSSTVYLAALSTSKIPSTGAPAPSLFAPARGFVVADAAGLAYDASSVVLRGVRSLSTPSDLHLTQAGADLLAARFLDVARQSVVVQVDAFGNPLRQVGDLVAYEDRDQTGVDGAFRLYGIQHQLEAGKYAQNVRMVEALQVGTWDDGVTQWDRGLWSTDENPGIATQAG